MTKLRFNELSTLPRHCQDWDPRLRAAIYDMSESGDFMFDGDKLIFQMANGGEMSFDWRQEFEKFKNLDKAFKQEPLARALSFKAGTNPSVLDATLGAGSDTIKFLVLGAQVTSYERHPIMLGLALDALCRARQCPVLAPYLKNLLAVNFGSVHQVSNGPLPEIFYYDPMFLHARQKNKAASKKVMANAHNLVGGDEDSDKVFNWALEKAFKRLIIKRPNKGLVLLGPKPTFQVQAKSFRYDVYCR